MAQREKIDSDEASMEFDSTLAEQSDELIDSDDEPRLQVKDNEVEQKISGRTTATDKIRPIGAPSELKQSAASAAASAPLSGVKRERSAAAAFSSECSRAGPSTVP